jgi:hypothetical protein
MCQTANVPPAARKKKPSISAGGVAFSVALFALLAALFYSGLCPDSELAQRQKLAFIGAYIWSAESDLRELDEATRTTEDEMGRAGLEYECLVRDIHALGPVRPDDTDLQSTLAKLVSRRDELDRVFEVLEDRQQKLRQQTFRRRDHLDRLRAERARILAAIHTQN